MRSIMFKARNWLSLMTIISMKELKAIITRPLFYVVTSMYMLLSGWLFFNYLAAAKDMTTLSVETTVFRPLLGNMNFVFLFIVPLLTMRSFSEERKDKTLDLLLSSRLDKVQIIAGKYLSLLLIISIFIGVLAVYPLILSFSGFENWSMIFSGLFGLVLTASCYIITGLFFSSLTDNQIISALMSYVFLFFCMLLIFSAQSTTNIIVAQILQYLSFLFHFEQFASGLIPSYSFVYYASFLGFFGYLTFYSLKQREW